VVLNILEPIKLVILGAVKTTETRVTILDIGVQLSGGELGWGYTCPYRLVNLGVIGHARVGVRGFKWALFSKMADPVSEVALSKLKLLLLFLPNNIMDSSTDINYFIYIIRFSIKTIGYDDILPVNVA